MTTARVPVGLSVTNDASTGPAAGHDPGPRPAPWLWPAVVAVALGPFVLTALGVAVAALRPVPRPATPAACVPAAPLPEPTPPVPTVETLPTPEPVEPGEARPPLDGSRPPRDESPAATVVSVVPEPIKVAAVKGPRCDRFGTAIDFVRSPALACDRAAREQKLVMVLHLAGHFEDPGFT
jgi:hypothetical protein